MSKHKRPSRDGGHHKSAGDRGHFKGARDGGRSKDTRDSSSFKGPREGGSFKGPREGGHAKDTRGSGNFKGPREGSSFKGPREGSSPREGGGFKGARDSSRSKDTRDSAPFKGAGERGSFKGPGERSSFKGTSERGSFKDAQKESRPRPTQPQASSPPRREISRPPREMHEHEDARPVRRSDEVWIFGSHAAAAALANPARKILRIVATTDAREKLAENKAIPARLLANVQMAARHDIEKILGEHTVHQGIAVLTRPLDHDIGHILDVAAADPSACILILDQVTDPQNVGTILRSAAAFGATAVVAPDRGAPDETGALAKAASGALESVAYVKAINLVRVIEDLKKLNFWIVGLDADAPQNLAQVKLDGRIALVLGAEGEGLRRLVRETCDHLAKLPMPGSMESLNVSSAAVAALYERARQNTAKS